MRQAMSDETKLPCSCGHDERSHTSGMYRTSRPCEAEGCGCADYSAMHFMPTGFTSPGDVLTPDTLRQRVDLLINGDTNLAAFFEAMRGQAAEMKRLGDEMGRMGKGIKSIEGAKACPHCGRDRTLYKHLCCEVTMLETMKAKRDADTANAIRWLEGLGYRVVRPGNENREGGGGV
jgi:hypothetical protein